jgi:hypothetical protein
MTLERNGKQLLRNYVVTLRVTRFRTVLARSPAVAAEKAKKEIGFWDTNVEVIEVEEVT